MKTHYTASEVGKAVGEDGETLRQWRKRGLCTIGNMGDRGHWHYSFFEVCQIAVAVSLIRFGESIEMSMNRVGGGRIRECIAAAIASEDDDQMLYFTTGISPAGVWESGIVTSLASPGGPKQNVTAQWEARDTINGCEEYFAEQIWQIDVARIVRRVERLLQA